MFFYLKKLLQSWFQSEIYLDHASTTPIDRRVLSVMNDIYRYRYGNPGGMYSLGIATTQVIDQSRKTVSRLLGAQPSQIIFTRGGTESNNMAILGAVNHFKNQYPDIVPHIITSTIEHDSVLATYRYLEQHNLVTVSYVPCNADGVVEVEVVKKALQPETILISVMYANNEIGTIQPIKEIAKLVRWWKKQLQKIIQSKQYKDDLFSEPYHTPALPYIGEGALQYPLLHTDAIQAVNYCDINVLRLGVDMMTVSGSKIYGPKSSGVLFVKNKELLDPVIMGGGQEFGLRSGTEDTAMIAGFAKALEISQEIKEQEVKRLTELQNYLITELLKDRRIVVNGGYSFNLTESRSEILHTVPHPNPPLPRGGNEQQRLPNNVNITIAGFSSESLVIQLAAHGFAVSSKSACQSDSDEESHVIAALRSAQAKQHSNPLLSRRDQNAEEGSLRITIGRTTTQNDIKKFTVKLNKILTV
jgi:cysteine desulfurase